MTGLLACTLIVLLAAWRQIRWDRKIIEDYERAIGAIGDIRRRRLW